MDFDLLSPEDLIELSWLDTYKKDIDHIWHQLVNLNTNIFILKKIHKFPFDVLKIDRSLFWQMVSMSLYEVCMLIIYRLVADTAYESSNIQIFKNKIIKHIKNEKNKKQVISELKSSGFNSFIKSLKPRIIELRNKRIAHYDINWNKDITVSQLNKIALGYDELFSILKSLTGYFYILCFSEKRSVEYCQYLPSSNSQTDIEIILDKLAIDSPLLNMPEQQKELWPHYRQDLSEDDISILNEYRKKINLNAI